MTIAIIKNAGPVPARVQSNARYNNAYPFDKLEVGDAFDVEGQGEVDSSGRYASWKSVSACASAKGKKTGKKFVCRRVSEKHVRIYRVS